MSRCRMRRGTSRPTRSGSRIRSIPALRSARGGTVDRRLAREAAGRQRRLSRRRKIPPHRPPLPRRRPRLLRGPSRRRPRPRPRRPRRRLRASRKLRLPRPLSLPRPVLSRLHRQAQDRALLPTQDRALRQAQDRAAEALHRRSRRGAWDCGTWRTARCDRGRTSARSPLSHLRSPDPPSSCARRCGAGTDVAAQPADRGAEKPAVAERRAEAVIWRRAGGSAPGWMSTSSTSGPAS